MYARARGFAAIFVAAAFLSGCSDDPVAPIGDAAPPLPPPGTMQLDFGAFENQPRALGTGQSREHWFAAVARVDYINTAMVAAFAPPALAFAVAVNTTPTLEADGSWLWTYFWMDSEGREVQIQLQAWVYEEERVIQWELRVSDNQAKPPLEDFPWFTGFSAIEGGSGHWIFNDVGTAGPVAKVRLDWEYTAADDRTLTVSLIDPEEPDFGDTLTYAVFATIVSVSYHDDSEAVDADITWDAITGAGSLEVPDYNAGVRACWDESQYDVDCPVIPS